MDHVSAGGCFGLRPRIRSYQGCRENDETGQKYHVCMMCLCTLQITGTVDIRPECLVLIGAEPEVYLTRLQAQPIFDKSLTTMCVRHGLFLLCTLMAAASFSCCQSRKSLLRAPLRTTNGDETWVNQTIRQLTLEEKVGQMLQIRVFEDSDLTGPEYAFVRDGIQKYHIGSVDLSDRMIGPNLAKGTPAEVAAMLNQLQQDSKIPLLVGADIERGLASRLSDCPEFPFPMAFGATGDSKLSEKFGEVTAEEARAVGIHWAYAPIADVNSNPNNPIINDRAFGENPQAVGDLVAAYIRGAHEGGMLVTVKHFPGEGDTSEDPHVGITRIDATRDHLDNYELPPFRKAIEAGADSVMLGHVMVPVLDPAPAKIATTSPEIVDGLLRKELGFHGVVITDALEMRGLTKLYPQGSDASGQIAVDAIKAGADVLMLPRNVDAAYNAILAAVKSGEIPESRIDESVRRILEMKAEVGLDKSRFVDVSRIPTVFGGTAVDNFAQQVSDAAVTLVRSNGRVLPLSAGNSTASQKPKLVVIISADSRRSRLGPTFEKEIIARRPDAVIFHEYNDQIWSDAPSDVMSAIATADDVVLATFETHAAGRQLMSFGTARNVVGLSGGSAEFFDEIINAAPKQIVVIALGSPYLIEDHLQIQNYICTYSLTPTAEVTAVKALFGEIQNHAKLPVTLPGVAERGYSLPWPAQLLAAK